MTIAPRTRLGPYEILAPIGAGGMGEVFRAKDTRLDRHVAIKVLPASMSSNPDLRQRFEREAKTISSLNHPHICALYDVGHQDGTDYLVMEFLEGETLEHRLAKGALPIDQALRYGIEIAEALEKAHRQGITHRDLKPGNIMLTQSGAKLLDFGLAKYRQQIEGAPLAGITGMVTEQKKNLTAEGTILGTFQYMAPEQLEGSEADARTDIFAFGAVLYEMVTGRRAFEGKTKTSLIAAIVDRDPPPITSLQPLSPPALERVIKTCLAKDPDDRWQTAHDVLLQLRWIHEAGSQAGVAAPVRKRAVRRESAAWIVAGIAVAAAIALFLNPRMAQHNAALLPYYGSISPPAGTEFWLGGPNAGAMTISPDSRYLTFVSPDKDGTGRIWVRDLHSREVRALAGTEGAWYPFWSPDSRQIGFFLNGKLKAIPVAGGASVEICEVNEPRGGTWSREGIILLAPHWRDPIHMVPAAGGKPVAVTRLDQSRSETTHRWPLFLPDGRHFLYFAGSHTSESTSGNNAVYVASLNGDSSRLLLRARSNVIYAAGHLLFLREQTLVAQRFDADSLELEGEPVPLAEGVRYEKGFFQAVFAASDTVLAYQGGGSETKALLNWISRKGETLGTLAESGVYYDVSIAPNGNVVAVTFGDPADIWLFDLARGSRSRFTFDTWEEARPTWSPDSKTILFWTNRNVQDDVLRKTIGSSEETPFLVDARVHEKAQDWSSDGRFVAVSRQALKGPVNSDIWIHPTDPSAKPFPFAATSFSEWDARFSPDGKLLAYVSNESGRDEVYVGSLPGSGEKTLISNDGGWAPRWRGDGREIYYLARNGKMMAVPIVSSSPFTTGAATPLFQVPIVFAPDPFYDVTADGQRFLISQPERTVEEPVTLVVNWTSTLKQK